MKAKAITYSAEKSIKELAELNSCSEATIRKYIKVNNIDRRYDNAVITSNRILNATFHLHTHDVAIIARYLNMSVATVKKHINSEIYVSEGKISCVASIGGNRTDGSKRAENDFYTTPSWAVEELLKNESFGANVWECCCGNDDITNVLKCHGHNVRNSDIVVRKEGQEQLDFLSSSNKDIFDGDIVTNVPYKQGLEFVLKALSLVKEGSKVAMLFPHSFLTSRKRFQQLFKNFPPKAVYIFPIRVCCSKNGDTTTKSGCVDFAWFVWEKGYSEGTQLIWTTPHNTSTKEILTEEIKEPQLTTCSNEVAISHAEIDTKKENLKELNIDVCRCLKDDYSKYGFNKLHYLEGVSNGSMCFLFRVNNDVAALCAVFNRPRRGCSTAMAYHRIVVLPQYQHLDIGKFVLNFIASVYKARSIPIYQTVQEGTHQYQKHELLFAA